MGIYGTNYPLLVIYVTAAAGVIFLIWKAIKKK